MEGLRVNEKPLAHKYSIICLENNHVKSKIDYYSRCNIMEFIKLINYTINAI